MDHITEKPYDVAIVGGGITGTAMLYTLSKYTDLERIVLLEKYGGLAHVNSHYDANSQTLHFGDIETNYTLEKARAVKQASSLLAGYAEKFSKDSILLSHKMVLAVGKEEVQELEKRYREFHELFPNLKKIGREEIFTLEPKVIEGRDPHQSVLALLSEKGYTLNYQKISNSFAEQALKENKRIDIKLGREILEITPYGDWWKIWTSNGEIIARFVVVTAGPHSLVFAKKLGFGKHLGILPVAGSFYTACGLLRGKVYTMQIKKLPFAAIHGDPNVNDPSETRFGPTAKPLPLLERHHWKTFKDFLSTSVYSLNGILSLLKIISDKTIFLYVLKNILFDLPYLGKRLFLQEVSKIIPTVRMRDLDYGRNLGGIRPQIVNTKTKQMEMGEAKIVEEGIIFDITPSPGASVCLDNARKNALIISKHLKGTSFDEQKFLADHAFEY
ncbi:MAG TPA: FAD-dependent oxidoreductase [Patescibacteria group bacterium]